jgi:hypothetical protein
MLIPLNKQFLQMQMLVEKMLLGDHYLVPYLEHITE